ncbi:MAG: ATP-binding protein [Candidatus Promineofilum sp.]|nr:ATP-binding protein [Promineifilum sp.]
MSGTNLTAQPRAEHLANPYVVGRPLTGASASLFAGREEVFAWLAENLTAAGPPNALLLYGERRIGKTSTLYQLVEGERGRALREGRRRLFPAYVDLQRLAGCHTDEWLRRLARDIYRQVAQHHPSRAMPRSRAGEDSAYDLFDRALDHLEQHLPADALILLAVDELEQLRAGIDAGLLDEAVFAFLRSQVQHRSRLAVLFSGSYGLLAESWRPLGDLTARYELGPLDFASAAALIRQPVAGLLAYDDEAVACIWGQTGGRPLPMQAICHRLVSLRNRQGRRDPIRADEAQWAIDEAAAAQQHAPGWAAVGHAEPAIGATS